MLIWLELCQSNVPDNDRFTQENEQRTQRTSGRSICTKSVHRYSISKLKCLFMSYWNCFSCLWCERGRTFSMWCYFNRQYLLCGITKHTVIWGEYCEATFPARSFLDFPPCKSPVWSICHTSAILYFPLCFGAGLYLLDKVFFQTGVETCGSLEMCKGAPQTGSLSFSCCSEELL